MAKNTRMSVTGWKSQIESLEKFCEKKGWEVEYTLKEPYSDTAHPTEKLLIIQRDRRPEITFYCFLHEIGHMLICQNQAGYDHKYGLVYEKFNEKSQTHKIVRVEEELDAWKHGLKLAKRLKLYVRRKKYEEIKARCVMTYVMWASKRKVKQQVSEALRQAQGTPNESHISPGATLCLTDAENREEENKRAEVTAEQPATEQPLYH